MSDDIGRARTVYRIDFDSDGPRIGSIQLLTKGFLGFAARNAEDLRRIFSFATSAAIDFQRLEAALQSIAQSLNIGDLALAAMSTSHLSLPTLNSDDLRRATEMDALLKASPDDPKRPGYPAGAPDGKGGQFRPKNASEGGTSDRAERLRRLANRKMLRSILGRVLSAKRVVKMIMKYVEAGIVEDVPILNDAVGAASLEDDLELMADMARDVADSDAAIEFVNKGPVELSELQRSPDVPQSFRSFDAFKKIDAFDKIELEKQFGPAGDGYDYHHIVEQGPNAGFFLQEQLQSTENIIRIPRLLHEELNSFYGSVRSLNSELTTPRLYLRGKSFEEQRQFGLFQLRRIGIIH